MVRLDFIGEEIMTREKTTSETNQTQRAEATPEEQELNRLLLERTRATQEGQIEVQGSGLNLINELLAGGELPGFLQTLPGGISEQTVGDISQRAVQDIRPSFQSSGILDSGTALEASAKVAGDVRLGAEEFNIGNLLNLLNLGVGGQAQIQQPLLAQQGQLGQQLSGLRTNTGFSSTVDTGTNPFLKSFSQSLGQNFGATGSDALKAFSY